MQIGPKPGLSKMTFDLNIVRSLCKELDMPDDVTKQISILTADIYFPDIEKYFNMLFSLETGGEAYKKIESELKENESSLKPLALYLTAANKTWEQYKKTGIPRKIYVDSMKCFSRFVREHFNTYGFYGFDRDFWIYRFLAFSIFRLGELEFEMSFCPDNDLLNGFAAKGDKIISVHIPSDAVMTRDNLNKSYEAAASFLKKYFPEYGNAITYCITWLLDPALKDLLPANSKILEFQSDYKIIKIVNNDKSFMRWVYNKDTDDYNSLPENTTLQRNIKKHLLEGGNISLATGIKK